MFNQTTAALYQSLIHLVMLLDTSMWSPICSEKYSFSRGLQMILMDGTFYIYDNRNKLSYLHHLLILQYNNSMKAYGGLFFLQFNDQNFIYDVSHYLWSLLYVMHL